MLNTDVRVIEAEPFFQVERAREPYKFGNAVMDRITLCHVRVRVRSRIGREADGWGAIFLSHYWAYPSATLSQETKDAAMRTVVERFCTRLAQSDDYGHPIDLFLSAEQDLASIAAEVTRELALADPIPLLAALVSASPVDAAVHDAFGICHGVSSYAALAPEFLPRLGRYIGRVGQGRHLSEFVRPTPQAIVPIFHSVGGLDRLTRGEVPPGAPDDGLPNSLDAWIERDGLTCLKVKLRGTDATWDLDRCVGVWRVARSVRPDLTPADMRLSLDPNEQCPDPQYMIDLLHRLRELEPDAFEAVLFVEQPTERDLLRNRFDLRPLSQLKPTMIDESLTGLADLDLAAELGWSGVAIKTCKCHTMALLTVAKAQLMGLPYCVQDLTNPGLALLHSVGLTAHLSPVLGVEANAREYFPATSGPEAAAHPDVFRVRDGVVRTASLSGPGLGYGISTIGRDLFAASAARS